MAEKEIAIKVENLYKAFQLPHANHSGIKQMLLSILSGKYKKGYEDQHVLHGISFDINKGDFFGIVGRNGSGKSTLLKLLAGIYVPDKGGVLTYGSLVPFIELGVGFNPELTGRENVFLNGALLGFSRKRMEAMYDEIVEFAELTSFMDQKLKNYSSGMQVRLAFSIAIRAESDILILDEVLAVGDAAFQQKCFDYFLKLKKEGRTVVLVTHDMSAVQRFCNKAIYLKNGEIIRSGSPADIAKLYLEENFSEAAEAQAGEVADSKNKLIVKTEKNNTTVTITSTFATKHVENKYVGLSFYKDGVISAEINSLQQPVDGKDGVITYTLDSEMLNPGAYEVDAVLFDEESRDIVAIAKKRAKFSVAGLDDTRGASLKLPHNWN